MIVEVNDGYLVKVPIDIRKPIISNWSDNTTTLEFYSNTYVMEYDSVSYTIDKIIEMKEITLPKQGNYKICRRIPKKYLYLIDNEKWFLIKLI